MARTAARRAVAGDAAATQPLARAGWQAQAASYVAAMLGVALVTLAIGLTQSHVQPGRTQMSYLLVVLALAIVGGSGPAVAASLLAFLAFDWFFVRPTGNLIIADADEWFALGLFLVVGISTGSLAAGLKHSADEARRRTRETATLYDLSIAVLATADLGRILDVIVQRLSETLHLPAAAILLADTDDLCHVVAERGLPRALVTATLPAPERPSGATPRSARAASPPLIAFAPLERQAQAWGLHGTYLPLVLNDRLLGVLAAFVSRDAPPLPREMLRLIDAFAAQSALAIGRARLATEEERARAAAESDRLKSVFLASLSHDLRTPLTAIKVAAALLGTEVTSATGAGAVNDIDQEVDRLNRLVGNLLDLSRIEGGGLLLRRVPEDLPTLVGATIERLTLQLAGRPIVFQSDEIPLVPLDPLQIERVLINLLENAAKFSAAGSPIAITVTASAEEVLLRLHNLGAPIPAAEQQQIFEKFHRLHRPAQIVDGAGLGLAICKGIIEGHGGRLWTANEAGGVAFYVALPLPQATTGSAIPAAVAS